MSIRRILNVSKQLLVSDAHGFGQSLWALQAPARLYCIQSFMTEKVYASLHCSTYPDDSICNSIMRCAGMQDELGFNLRGTTDAALVLQQSISVGVPANGIRWLWKLNPQLHSPTAGVLAGSSSVPSSSTSNKVCHVYQCIYASATP